MNKNPKISVFTTCFNSGEYLEETLESILIQDFDNYEIVIVDGGSTDKTESVLKQYINIDRLKIFVEPGINWNDGLMSAFEKTCGDYVMCMPISDCYNSHFWFKRCSDILDENLDISLVHGISIHNNDNDEKYFGKATRKFCPSGKDFLQFWSATYYCYPEHTPCVRRNVFKKCMETPLPFHMSDFKSHFSEERINSKNYFFNNFLKFTYNFNTLGYLPHYVPLIAALVREHDNQSSYGANDIDSIVAQFYVKMINKYRESISKGIITHYFRNGNGQVIDKLVNKELKNYIKDTINYRLYEKTYFIPPDFLSTFGKIIIFRIKRFLSRIVRNFIYYYYKSYQVFNVK